MQIFQEVLFFKLRTTLKTEKQTIDSTYLVSVGCGRLAEGKGHETDFVYTDTMIWHIFIQRHFCAHGTVMPLTYPLQHERRFVKQ